MTLFRTSILSAIETIIKLSAGLVVIKFIAMRTGPDGVAIFGQFQNFVSLVILLSSGVFANGLVKYTAEFLGNDEESQKFYQNSIGLGLVLSVIIGGGVYILSEELAEFVLDEHKYAWIVKLFSFVIIFITLYQIFIAILNGRNELKKLIVGKISSSCILLTLAVFLVFFLGIDGALLSISLVQALACFIVFMFLIKVKKFNKQWLIPKFELRIIKKFIPYWIVSFTTVISTPIVFIGIRMHLVDSLGWEFAGYWEATTKISELYLLVITTALVTYYLPKLSAANNYDDENKIINQVLVYAIGTSVMLALIVYFFKGIIVNLLYTSDFDQVKELLGIQLLGSVVKIFSWVFSYYMIAKKKIYAFLLSELFFGLTFFCLNIIFINWFGLVGTTYAFLTNYIFYGLFCFGYYKYSTGINKWGGEVKTLSKF
ncbi:O-antigen translocase [Zooshikella sp. RANM57]|uniref:O-antigen translocase n=1 Tax=Zooshikella sp. RANM57 TaxID=3425863 RepID=UPI003D6DF5B9